MYSSVNEKRSLSHTFESQGFSATVILDEVTGKKSLQLASQMYFDHAVSKFREGEKVTLQLTNKKPKRTEQQNRYYWLYLTLISKETGEQDIEGLHELFKGKFLTEKIATILGEPVRKKRSTTSLSVNDFSEFITAIETFTEIQAPPTENFLA